ncbi:MAG TPA: polysaccharide biosynthesis/export family protein [Candidatus Paceibacterota bacterium]|nr:polysaccharide biosynthesis/export family protein [Verrucomicrobiota bacterium]HRY47080.1 polysaccharide biosynthesis/export family protein [Candidatus Paceibacterota bacterium]HSA00350.1 polysaccharide biosynthesis/export family protein [Candidatus Paceibacterota bacterium]
MNKLLRHAVFEGALLSCLLGILLLTGCSTPGPASEEPLAATAAVSAARDGDDILRENDLVSIVFSGIPNPPDRHDERISASGQITLHLVGTITAGGKTPAQLQEEIHKAYVPRFFNRLVVTVQTENRFFFVSGEVKNPSRLVYAGGMTVLKAIAAAGDFTDFANKKTVLLTRQDGRKFVINTRDARKKPELDLPVVPGDVIYVPKRKI